MQIKEPVKILDVPVHPLTMQEAVSALEESIANGEQAFVVTANAEIIMMCQQDAEYKKIVSQDAQLVLADGAGAVWAGRHLGYKVPERVAGFDLYCNLLKEAIRLTSLVVLPVLRKLLKQNPKSFIPEYKLLVVVMVTSKKRRAKQSSMRLTLPKQICSLLP